VCSKALEETAVALNLEDFNARWLQSWTDKDVPALLRFYAPDVIYRDPQTANGIQGHKAPGDYLSGLFGATPPMRYAPDEIWPTANGFCGRWYCTISPAGGEKSFMRGFDLVVLEGDRIVLNEVYVHLISALPAPRR
jgi:SnoaL-like domain